MGRRNAVLILIALLALADLVGVALLRSAWTARHDSGTTQDSPAVRAQPANEAPVGARPPTRTGT